MNNSVVKETSYLTGLHDLAASKGVFRRGNPLPSSVHYSHLQRNLRFRKNYFYQSMQFVPHNIGAVHSKEKKHFLIETQSIKDFSRNLRKTANSSAETLVANMIFGYTLKRTQDSVEVYDCVESHDCVESYDSVNAGGHRQ